MNTKNIKQETEFEGVTPKQVYDALMDSKQHSKFTNSEAKIDARVGGKFSIFNGGLNGKTIELKEGKKIVQEWKSEEENWPENHYSKIVFDFEKTGKGTKLKFTQARVPEKCFKAINQGWKDYYWNPMKEYFKNKKEVKK